MARGEPETAGGEVDRKVLSLSPGSLTISRCLDGLGHPEDNLTGPDDPRKGLESLKILAKALVILTGPHRLTA